jgi:hypothetical protein
MWDRVRFDTGKPEAFKHPGDHATLAWDIASFQGIEGREEAGVANHVLEIDWANEIWGFGIKVRTDIRSSGSPPTG